MSSIVDTTLDLVKNHQEWAVPIVFLLAFGESLAFISLLIPATIILWGIGALIGVLATIGHAAAPAPSAWLAIDEPSAIEIKLALVVVVAAAPGLTHLVPAC